MDELEEIDDTVYSQPGDDDDEEANDEEDEEDDELDRPVFEGPQIRTHRTVRSAPRRYLENPLRDNEEDEQQSPKLSWRDLYEFEALEMAEAQSSDLDNEVHPIFQPENFDCSTWMYDAILPCLQLATRMLDDAHALHWFDALLNCPRRHLPETSLMSHDLSNFPDPTFAGHNDFEEHIGDRYSFHLRNPFEAHHFMAVQEVLRTFKDAIIFEFRKEHTQSNPRPDEPFRQGFKTIISLDHSILGCLTSPETHSICQTLRKQLMYTVFIMHELAHAVSNSTRHHDWEDYFENNRLSECGYSLEQAIFGGRVSTATADDECTGALYIHDWPDFDDVDCPFSPPRWAAPADSWYNEYVVPMPYVQKLFTNDFWEVKNMARAGAITLKIPKTVCHRVWNDGRIGEGYERLLEAENEVYVAYRAAEFGVFLRE
ncbi:MAG: hypothetical protein M1812_004013 [Candelaria pacifica]|nr:MAG: hypothetical protein M1812_004013 [Candelaria pacifica]